VPGTAVAAGTVLDVGAGVVTVGLAGTVAAGAGPLVGRDASAYPPPATTVTATKAAATTAAVRRWPIRCDLRATRSRRSV
jgi:hypothetical protein